MGMASPSENLFSDRVRGPLWLRFLRLVKNRGLSYALASAVEKFRQPRLANYAVYHANLVGKHGLEIGGPTGIFRAGNLLPIYPIISSLDSCNFSAMTMWEGKLEEGQTFFYDEHKPRGYQFIRDAVNLNAIHPDYDFVAASHVIEHIANPLRAIGEWLRVLKAEESILMLVVPHKDGTFDHRRPVTPFQHLLDDLAQDTPENDLTHLAEILDRHDLARDRLAGDFEAFRKRSLDNYHQRALHHHVFDTALAVRLFDYFNLQIIAVDPVGPYHIVIMGKKLPMGARTRNDAFLSRRAKYRLTSPFPSDRN